MAKFSWNDENTTQLTDLAGAPEASVITQDQLSDFAETLGTTNRSVGSKLRKMGYDVQKASETVRSSWTTEQEDALVNFLDQNAGELTYAQIAATFLNGAFTAKQVQGKVLSLERTSQVKKTEKVAAPRTYTPEQEETFIAMANKGASIEDIAEAVNMTIQSVRGKALSLTKSHGIPMPKQVTSSAKTKVDVLEGLSVAEMTVAELVDATGRTERGIKSMLSRRGISCADYDGEAKRAKLDAKNAE